MLEDLGNTRVSITTRTLGLHKGVYLLQEDLLHKGVYYKKTWAIQGCLLLEALGYTRVSIIRRLGLHKGVYYYKKTWATQGCLL